MLISQLMINTFLKHIEIFGQMKGSSDVFWLIDAEFLKTRTELIYFIKCTLFYF